MKDRLGILGNRHLFDDEAFQILFVQLDKDGDGVLLKSEIRIFCIDMMEE